MDAKTAQERRERFYDPKNVTYRKVAGRYGWAWNCIGIQILFAQGLAILLMFAILIFKVVMNPEEAKEIGTDISDIILSYSIPIAALSFCIGNPLASFISLKKTKAAKFGDYFKKPQIGAGLIVLAVLATLGISSFDSIIMDIFTNIFGASSEQLNTSISSGIYSENLFLSIVSFAYVCVLGPFFEELLCRGAIQTLAGHISPKMAVFASAFMFGIFHLNISQFYNAFLLGLLFGYVTLRARSIWPTVIMHIANNSLYILLMPLTKNMTEQELASFSTKFSIITAVAGIIALIVFIVIEKNNKDKTMAVIITNKPASDEEIKEAGLTGKELTVKPFFTRWQFFLIIGFFIFNCLSTSIMANL